MLVISAVALDFSLAVVAATSKNIGRPNRCPTGYNTKQPVVGWWGRRRGFNRECNQEGGPDRVYSQGGVPTESAARKREGDNGGGLRRIQDGGSG